MTNTLAMPANLSIDSLDDYVGNVSRFKLLSADEEKDLARRFRQQDDLDAARQLVLANLRFVVHIARGYNGYGLALPDLIQEGNIGLMKAVKRFDPDVGVRLVSFAVHWIRAEIHEYVIKNWRIVKVATTKAQRKLFFNLRSAKKRLAWLNHGEAQTVADDLGVKVETVYEMEKRLDGHDIAFDNPLPDNERSQHAPASYLAHQEADPAVLVERSEYGEYQQGRLDSAMQQLDERSLDILNSRWLGEKKTTLVELANRYGVSAERIRQLENNALKKLKASFAIEV